MSDERLFPLELIPRRTSGPGAPPLPEAMNDLVTVREFGAWTLDKLDVLTAYFKMYRRVAGSGTYIDAFAGEGHALIRGKRTEGSPLRAANTDAFRYLHLFEQNRKTHRRLAVALEELTPKRRARITLHPACDSNHGVLDLLASGAIPQDKPCFAFLDPNSTELAWATVEALASYKLYIGPEPESSTPVSCKIELWILLNTHQALGRLLPTDRGQHRIPPHASTLDRVMGGRDAWWDVWTAPHCGAGLLAHAYTTRLREELGYLWVHAQQVNDPNSGRPQYHMIHASDHPNAHTLMRSAKRDRLLEKRPLPGI